MVFLKSCGLLPGLGPDHSTELRSDEPGFDVQQHRPRRGEGLVFGEDGIMRGRECQAQPYESDTREISKGDAAQD